MPFSKEKRREHQAKLEKRLREAKDADFLEMRLRIYNNYASKPENQIKIKARNKVKHLCRVGKMKREACKVCGELKTHAHHTDYSKPLDVVWLCSPCHHKEHQAHTIGTSTPATAGQ